MKKVRIYLLFGGIVGLLAGCATKIQSTQVMPCSMEETADSHYIREVGHGVSDNLQMARRESMIDAKIKILSYLLSTSLSIDSVVFLQTDILPFEKECEKVYFSENQYHVYTRLACPMPDEERLLYYRERFRRYAEEKQREMLENQQIYNEKDTCKKSDSLQNGIENNISPK